MNLRAIIIFIGLTTLVLGLNYGSLIEITYQPAHRIGVLFLAVLVCLSFYFLYLQTILLTNRAMKFLGLGLTTFILLPYLWIGLWTVPQAVFSDEYPMYEDIAVYSNQDGETLFGQFIEISGSLHHYQIRKVVYDFKNGIRISYIYSDQNINGMWTYHQRAFDNGIVSTSDTTYTAQFVNGKEINYPQPQP